MPTFIKKPERVEAHRWFKNGDHPEDGCRQVTDRHGVSFQTEGAVVRRYKFPNTIGLQQRCAICGGFMGEHGWIDIPWSTQIVCPGDWIITMSGDRHHAIKPDLLKALYEPVENI